MGRIPDFERKLQEMQLLNRDGRDGRGDREGVAAVAATSFIWGLCTGGGKSVYDGYVEREAEFDFTFELGLSGWSGWSGWSG